MTKVTISLDEYYKKEFDKVVHRICNKKLKDAIKRVKRMNKRAENRIKRRQIAQMKLLGFHRLVWQYSVHAFKQVRCDYVINRYAVRKGYINN